MIDDECDGSGILIQLCSTYVPHVHCECGEPMIEEAELQRGYCEAYCVKERQGISLLCPFPQIEKHGTMLVHSINGRQPNYIAAKAIHQGGIDMIAQKIKMALATKKKKREKLEGDALG